MMISLFESCHLKGSVNFSELSVQLLEQANLKNLLVERKKEHHGKSSGRKGSPFPCFTSVPAQDSTEFWW